MTDPGQNVMRGLLEVFLLESLDAAPKHGYALLKEMEARFGLEPNRNRIYPLLQKFEDAGLVVKKAADNDARGRSLYALTDAGRRQLDAYRRLPGPFRDAVQRLWGGQGGAPADPMPRPAAATASPSEPPRDPPARETPEPHAAPEPPTAARDPAIPVPVQGRAGAGKPYPCPDARVHFEKDPTTGNLDVRLRGCPMGAFDYCPECPVFKSVAGLKGLLFGNP